MILPGKSFEIDVTVDVNYNTAGDLNKGASLKDMLVIHVEHGKDYFVGLTGSFREYHAVWP